MEKKIVKTRLVIIGAGPAGVTAAVYGARAGLEPVVFESGLVGGQAAQSSLIENYPGYVSISGGELAEKFRAQLAAADVTLEEFDPILRTRLSAEVKRIETESKIYEADAVIIASGTCPKPLPATGEARFRGRGVHYCALCDGSAYKGKTVGVVGGGSAALEEALYLSGIAERVVMIRRKSGFHGESALLDRALRTPNIEILYNTELADVGGGDRVEYALLGDGRRLPLSAVFVYIGSTPATELFRDEIALNGQGYIIADGEMRTSVPGVFAAGDVREKSCRQIVTAVSDGAVAAINAKRWLEVRGKK